MINQELINFIKQSLKQGNTKDKISSDLLSNGWNDFDIAEGFNAVSELDKKNSVSSVATPSVQPSSLPVSSNISNTSYSSISSPNNSVNINQPSTNENPSNVYHPIYQTTQKAKNIWNYILVLLILILAGFVYLYSGLLFKSPDDNQNEAQENSLLEEQTAPLDDADSNTTYTEEAILIDEATKDNTDQNSQENTQALPKESSVLPYQVSFESPLVSIKSANGEKISLKIRTGEKIKSVKMNFFISYKNGKNDLKEFDVLTKDGYAEYVYTTPSVAFKSIDVIAEGVSDNKIEQSKAESKLSQEELLERFLTILSSN